MGFGDNALVSRILQVLGRHYKHEALDTQIRDLKALKNNPTAYADDEVWGAIAQSMQQVQAETLRKEIALQDSPVSVRIYGREQIEPQALSQIETAALLPISVAAALMPDAHLGYGLPIGGVLATENAVIPYGVGVDIGCRMALSVFDLKAEYLSRYKHKLMQWLQEETRFGMGGEHKQPLDDELFEHPTFREVKLAATLKEKAVRQIGTSGSGNHFVEFGIVQLSADNDWDLPAGDYVGLLSHSGSRGLGASIANHYTQLAMKLTPLPREARHLAWLDLDTQEGMEYWLAMNLAGEYAAACHRHIHYRLAKAMGEKPLAKVENHHNFAWKEQWEGREVIVHRKGATPAAKGVLGIIPGSMTAQGYIVRGLGEAAALNSASHGAGRLLSRQKATETLSKKEFRQILEKYGVELIGGAIDEAPMAYKDIETVMQAQKKLVEVVGTFQPKIVRMDG